MLRRPPRISISPRYLWTPDADSPCDITTSAATALMRVAGTYDQGQPGLLSSARCRSTARYRGREFSCSLSASATDLLASLEEDPLYEQTTHLGDGDCLDNTSDQCALSADYTLCDK